MSPLFPEKKNPSPAAAGAPEKLSDRAPRLVKPKKIKISKLLTEDSIIMAPKGADKKKLIELLVEKLCASKDLKDPGACMAKVMEREQGISTTLDTGLSLPHARMDCVKNIVAAMALVPDGIVDPAQSDLTIRLMFLFFSSTRSEMLPLHLQLLRAVSSLFQPAVIAQVSAAPGPAEALEIIRKVEA